MSAVLFASVFSHMPFDHHILISGSPHCSLLGNGVGVKELYRLGGMRHSEKWVDIIDWRSRKKRVMYPGHVRFELGICRINHIHPDSSGDLGTAPARTRMPALWHACSFMGTLWVIYAAYGQTHQIWFKTLSALLKFNLWKCRKH